MKSANSNRTAPRRRPARLWLVAPLCLLALACGLLAGSASRVASAAAAQEKTKGAAADPGKERVGARGARPDSSAKPAIKSRDAHPLADQIGCATNPQAITIGGTVSGTLSSGDCRNTVDQSFYDAYTFQGTAGQFVLISMTSSAVDSYLYLLRPNETALTYRTIQNDDTLGPNNTVLLDSRIIAVLPETGTYTILANTALANQTGSYQLSVGGGCAATPNIVSGTLNGSLGGSDCRLHDNSFIDVYSFNATAGQQVSVSMSSTAIDSFLFLLSNDGFTELARNDDGLTGGGDGNRGARIPAPSEGAGTGLATLPAAGTYYIIANSFSPNETGNYQLTLNLGANCPVVPITGGQTLNGTLATSDCRLPFDGSFLDVYTFEGTANQQLSVTMTSTAFNTYLLLYDPAGFLIDEDNDGGGGTNARIPADSGTITLPVSGTYRIYANAVAPGLTGAYQLTVASTANCPVTLAQASRQNVSAAGGQFTDSFTVPAGCAVPSATTTSSFITGITPTVNAQGQGSFTYTVAPNTTTQSRTGTITVGSQTFTVTQQGACGVGLAPTVRPFAQPGGTGRFTVVPNDASTPCSWTATTAANWITIDTGATGSGTGRVTYTVAANTTGATRTGTINVNGQAHTVTQLAGAAPTVAFSTATYTFSEANPARVMTVTVSRLGDIAGASTVEYRTTAETPAEAQVPCNPAQQTNLTGTASPRCDYATTVDTLTFAPNEAEKSFSIPLINDVHDENAETLQVELLNPVGATLGAQATATVTINDDDTGVSSTNPVRPPRPYNADTPRFFVRMHYLDFLSREPEVGEPWSNILATCPDPENGFAQVPNASSGCDRLAVSRSFFESPEFSLKGFFVFLHYKASFGAAANPNFFPEYRDIVTDMRRVTGQTAAETIAKRFDFTEEWVTRAAFTTRYGTRTNAEYVDELLANLNATLTQARSGFTRDSLVADLNAGTKTRAEVLRLIVESQEVIDRQFNHAYVAMQYYGYLRRTPDLGGYQGWLNVISAPGNVDVNRREMVNGFLNSSEYVHRFGPS